MTRTMRLIAEGKSDSVVMQYIFKKKGIDVRVESVLPSGGGGIPQLAIELEDLIDGAIRRQKTGDCIVVLHDADQTKALPANHRKHYERIKMICEKTIYTPYVTLITAYDELEAWLIADAGLCNWLDTKPRTNCDSIEKPKNVLGGLIRKHNPRMQWSERYWDTVLKNIDASGEQRSDSMRKAFVQLNELPCLKALHT